MRIENLLACLMQGCDSVLGEAGARGRRRRRSMLLITHHLAGLEHRVDEVAVLKAGRMARRMPVAACSATLAQGDLAR